MNIKLEDKLEKKKIKKANVSSKTNPRWMDLAVDPVMLSTADGKVVRGLGGIPSDGPVIYISNHMMLGLDLAPLFSTFWLKQNIKLRGLAHPVFFDGIVQEAPHINVVRMTGGVPVSANNFYRLLKSKSHVLMYPGGIREALHRRVNPACIAKKYSFR